MPARLAELARIDLNQLAMLAAILDERHVSRAADRAAVSQPAASRILARMRATLGDDLLVRVNGSYERTPRGEQLLRDLADLLPRLNAAVGGPAFDPVTADRRFRLTGTDHAAAVLVPGVVRRCRRSAPGVRVDVVRYADDSYHQTAAGQCDLAVGVGSAPALPAELRVAVLYTERFACLVAADRPGPAGGSRSPDTWPGRTP